MQVRSCRNVWNFAAVYAILGYQVHNLWGQFILDLLQVLEPMTFTQYYNYETSHSNLFTDTELTFISINFKLTLTTEWYNKASHIPLLQVFLLIAVYHIKRVSGLIIDQVCRSLHCELLSIAELLHISLKRTNHT